MERDKIELTDNQIKKLKELCGEKKALEMLVLDENSFISELDYMILDAKEGPEFEPTQHSNNLQALFDDIIYGE